MQLINIYIKIFMMIKLIRNKKQLFIKLICKDKSV